MKGYYDISNIPQDTNCYIQFTNRHNNLFKQISLEYLSWTEVVDTNNLSMPLDELLYIIDDCLVYHIEFKVEDHKLFMRNY